MDLPFLHSNGRLINKSMLTVSILVLMDLPFLQIWKEKQNEHRNNSFNPCSYGSSVLTHQAGSIYSEAYSGFNPCSYGSSVLTKDKRNQNRNNKQVSILVLMDLPFLLFTWLRDNGYLIRVSILVLMDLPFLQKYARRMEGM